MELAFNMELYSDFCFKERKFRGSFKPINRMQPFELTGFKAHGSRVNLQSLHKESLHA